MWIELTETFGKMIVLRFLFGHETMTFLVKNREVWFSQPRLKKEIRCFPKDPDFLRIIMASRNRYPSHLIKMFEVSKEEEAEYEETKLKGDEALADKIIIDCQKKGLRLLHKEIKNE